VNIVQVKSVTAIDSPKPFIKWVGFCRLLGLGCPKQAFTKIATPRSILFLELTWKKL
jgi:hypothetical protein